jgi:hypothetical protein
MPFNLKYNANIYSNIGNVNSLKKKNANKFVNIGKKMLFCKKYKKMVEKTQSQIRYENQKTFVVVLNCAVVGTWRNLKKLCEDMKGDDEDFQSYWTLAKKREESPIKFSTSKGEYQIYIEKLK